jgi:type I restriction enzyme R subunit
MKTGEHKTVQAKIIAYAEAIGWTIVFREEAEQRRGFDPETPIKKPTTTTNKLILQH